MIDSNNAYSSYSQMDYDILGSLLTERVLYSHIAVDSVRVCEGIGAMMTCLSRRHIQSP